MGRIHLFEFEDLKWFPSFLRNYMTDFLQFVSNKFDVYKPIVSIIEEGLEKSKSDTIIDLASGGGGGILKLNESLLKRKPNLKIILTDYYPNIEAFKHTKASANNIEYITTSIDALNVPKSLEGLRTQFLSLHHFKPMQAQQILQNVINNESAIAIFEAQERNLKSITFMLLSPINVLLLTPFIKPFKFGRLLFTYLFPILPILVCWDGLVSVLRTYSIKEMNKLINGLSNGDSYEWKLGKVKSGPSKITYLLGYKK
ncbi:hypothetical protein [Jejuia spongiicola]|uniref:Class I SAM-dependent methyltransferase n=1 Tax=Jejuia spongiicola TaxID=2942207 RepID=A0ABT0QIK0_9FLAO|nr:hypothetical protein [Jejuia spongiicola]MCL6295810.1 hypothetical protein [Jejuia spongiicola]